VPRLFILIHGLSLHKLLMAPLLLSRESAFEFKLSEIGFLKMAFQFQGAPRSSLSLCFGPPLDARLFSSLISVSVMILQFVYAQPLSP
jgi:hypothetical protein